MTDLSPAVWKEIEEAAFAVNRIVPQEEAPGMALKDRARSRQVIEIGALKTILRKSRRTTDQNALLWALYADAKERGGELLGGWDTETLHDYMLGEYFGWVTTEALGRKRQTPAKRSSRLTKMEFSDFVEFVVRRFAEHGIVLELPGENAA